MKAAQALYATEPGAVAAAMTLLMNFRASEVTKRVIRDLDDNCRLVWITKAKTRKGNRGTQVPLELQEPLRVLTAGRDGAKPLFEARGGGHHWRDWPREWVQRICRLAGVDKVTAHSMRGLHADLAIEAGATSEVVAASLGHESFAITAQSYAKADTVGAATQKRALRALEGGST